MFQMRIFLFPAIILLLASCNERGETFFDREIEYRDATIISELLFDEIVTPRKMRVINNHLLISDARNSPSFHVMDIHDDGTLTYNRGLGREGRGPGEFGMVEDFIDADSLIYVYDSRQLKVVVYDYNFNLKRDREITFESIDRPLGIFPASGGRFLSAGLFLGGERFQLIGPDGTLIGTYGELPPFDDYSPRNLALAWYSAPTAFHNGEYIYLFSSYSHHIEKYALNGSLIQRVTGSDFPRPKLKLEQTEAGPWPVDDGGIYSYLWADTDEEFIYALYSGEYRSRLDGFEADKIHVLDSNLNLVSAYLLDHSPFTISVADTNILYTVENTIDGAILRHVILE